ncbi:MAG: hypothetical protein ABUL77_02095 [Bacteroidota bacterium]
MLKRAYVRRHHPALLVLLLASVFRGSPGSARADAPVLSSSTGAPCGPENLLAGKRPSHWQDLRGDATLVTDGAVAPEGAEWNAPVAVVFDTLAGSVTYDLGAPTPVAALVVQADANDTYKVQGSLDGTPGSFKLLVDVDNVSDRGHGLRTRSVQIPPEPVRFLRVGEGVGDGFFSLSEFAAFCQTPTPFPPVFRTTDAPLATVVKRPWYKFDWWEDHASARFEMCLALAALLLLAWGYRAEKTGKDVVLSDAAPTIVCGVSLGLHVAITVSIIYGTIWLPKWASILALYFWCEFTVLATPTAARFVTPLRFVIRLLRARSSTAAAVAAPPPATPAAAVRGQLLVLIGILSFMAYWNFGAFHFGNYTHYHEAYHYYVGSKYFPELAYDRLYECTAVADSEDPSLRRRVELRKMTNLRTNILESTKEILAHPERCKQNFTPERWESFKQDIKFFRDRNGTRRWEDAQYDHGYNATPVWNALGSTLAGLSPATDGQLWYLTRLDPLLIIGMCLMIWWAFGWRTLCVAMAVFATNFPSRFYWTGGSFLRWDWLFHMTAGICLIKKGRPLLGGYLMAYSALLRVFPGFLFAGPLFVIAQQLLAQTKGRRWWQRLPPRELPQMFRRVDRGSLAIIMGAALAVATLVPISLVVGGSVNTYKMFVQNSKKHTATPLTNYMGWRTVVAYKEQEAGRYLKTDRLEDPWKDWKDARLRTFHQRRWLYVAGILGFIALLYRAVRDKTAWEAAALSSVLIAAVPELTSYYYAFLIVPALLWARRPEAGMALLGVTAATGFFDWAPTQYLPRKFPLNYLQMPTWLDEQYTWMAAATLLGIGYVLYLYGFVRRPEPAAAQDDHPATATSAGKAVAAAKHSPRKPGHKKPRRP